MEISLTHTYIRTVYALVLPMNHIAKLNFYYYKDIHAYKRDSLK